MSGTIVTIYEPQPTLEAEVSVTPISKLPAGDTTPLLSPINMAKLSSSALCVVFVPACEAPVLFFEKIATLHASIAVVIVSV